MSQVNHAHESKVLSNVIAALGHWLWVKANSMVVSAMILIIVPDMQDRRIRIKLLVGLYKIMHIFHICTRKTFYIQLVFGAIGAIHNSRLDIFLFPYFEDFLIDITRRHRIAHIAKL